jgi:ZIP family zinc transporter
MTALGAAVVFTARDVSKKVLDTMLGFAGGVMIAASYWSLLAPAIEMSEGGNLPVWVPPAVGFLISILAFPLRRPKASRHPGGAAPCLSSP